MNSNVSGVIFSVLLISVCFVLSFFVKKFVKKSWAPDFARKVIHIGVANWYFIYRSFFTTWVWPVAGLVAFAIINYFLEKKKVKTSWGMVQYPLVIVALLMFNNAGIFDSSALGCAILSMGYGDGLAAISGILVGKAKLPFNKDKTVVGFIVCFAAITTVCYLLSGLSFAICVAIGFIGSLTEAYTPFGLDNISLPLVIYLMVGLLC